MTEQTTGSVAGADNRRIVLIFGLSAAMVLLVGAIGIVVALILRPAATTADLPDSGARELATMRAQLAQQQQQQAEQLRMQQLYAQQLQTSVAGGAGQSAPAAPGVPAPQTPIQREPGLPGFVTPPAGVPEQAASFIGQDLTQTMSNISQYLHAVTSVPEGADAARPITIFYDPRCPYCHKAFDNLNGKLPIRWVPVLTLGQDQAGATMFQYILDEGRKSTADGLAAMARVFKTRQAPGAGPLRTETGTPLVDNQVFFSAVVSVATPQKIAVPLMVIPTKSGAVKSRLGFSDGDAEKVIAEYNS